jgi:hypothetical protein
MKLNEFINAIISHPEYLNHLNADMQFFTELLGSEMPIVFNKISINFCTMQEGEPPLVQIAVNYEERPQEDTAE